MCPTLCVSFLYSHTRCASAATIEHVLPWQNRFMHRPIGELKKKKNTLNLLFYPWHEMLACRFMHCAPCCLLWKGKSMYYTLNTTWVVRAPYSFCFSLSSVYWNWQNVHTQMFCSCCSLNKRGGSVRCDISLMRDKDVLIDEVLHHCSPLFFKSWLN